jgi:hypothetical protein
MGIAITLNERRWCPPWILQKSAEKAKIATDLFLVEAFRHLI